MRRRREDEVTGKTWIDLSDLFSHSHITSSYIQAKQHPTEPYVTQELLAPAPPVASTFQQTCHNFIFAFSFTQTFMRENIHTQRKLPKENDNSNSACLEARDEISVMKCVAQRLSRLFSPYFGEPETNCRSLTNFLFLLFYNGYYGADQVVK